MPVLACDVTALSEPERTTHFALGRALLEEARERIGLENGYTFRLPAARLEDIARFIRNERRCCGFPALELNLPAGEETVWLRMTGPAGTRAVLDQTYTDHQGGR